jgi:hypothetical protein
MPAKGDWPGYDRNGNVRKRITRTAMNMRSLGYALFNSSASPEFDT